jgi:hypothetical protein
MIPMEVATHENHTCGGRKQEKWLFLLESVDIAVGLLSEALIYESFFDLRVYG